MVKHKISVKNVRGGFAWLVLLQFGTPPKEKHARILQNHLKTHNQPFMAHFLNVSISPHGTFLAPFESCRMFACLACVWLCRVCGCVNGLLTTGSRVNALLGGSVLHPTGGGYALAVLASPTLMSAICLSGCASVWLYDALAEEQVTLL